MADEVNDQMDDADLESAAGGNWSSPFAKFMTNCTRCGKPLEGMGDPRPITCGACAWGTNPFGNR